jgi:ankyrin repeat protein
MCVKFSDPAKCNGSHEQLYHLATHPSRKGENGFPPLVYLCRADKGEQPEKIKLLLAYHAPVNGMGPKGRTALHYAAAAGFLEVMAILLDHGADYRIRDHQGETPACPGPAYYT